MKIQVKLNDDDYIAYNIYHNFHSPNLKKGIQFGRYICALVSLCAIAILILTGFDRTVINIEIVACAAFSIFGYIYYPLYVKKSIRRNILKMKKEGKLPYDEEATIELAEVGIVETAPGKVTQIPYSDVLEIADTDEYIYIRFGAQQTFILPHRCLDDKGAVLDFLHQKCSHIIR